MLELIVLIGGLFPALGEISRPIVTHVPTAKCVDRPSRSAPTNAHRGEIVNKVGSTVCEKHIVT